MEPESAPEAWILTIGNEILVGRIVNTNAAYLARRLTFLGFTVSRMIVVPDDVEEIAEEASRALGRRGVRAVFTTGGLGPTHDDVTLEGIAKALGLPLEINKEALEMVERFYRRRGLPLTRERVKMARLPLGAKPLPNPAGAAPGVLVEARGKVVVALPGVPREMEAIFEDSVVGVLSRIAPPRSIVECGIIIRGVPESSLAPRLEEIARKHPSSYIKSHPKGHEIDRPVLDVRVISSAADREDAVRGAREALALIARAAKELGGEVEEEPCPSPG